MTTAGYLLKLVAAEASLQPLLACAVCFGKPAGSGLFKGLTWGLIVLLGATFLILAVFALAILRIEKAREEAERRRSAASSAAPATP